MKGSCITMYGLVLREKYGTDGITKTDVMDMFDMLDGTEAYPIELSAYAQESSAKDNKIELPALYKCCKQNFGKKVIYSLEKDSIKIIVDNADDDKIFGYFREEDKETRYIILDNFLELNTLAIKTLRILNRDIVELCIDEEMIVISKPQL